MVDRIKKRDGRIVEYDKQKIKKAIRKAEKSVKRDQNKKDFIIININEIVDKIEIKLNAMNKDIPEVEEIQDIVEETLMDSQYKGVAREYITYRESRNRKRNENWLISDIALSIWERKYRYNGETLSEFLERVSGNNLSIRKLIHNKMFIPAGRILANRKLDILDNRKITLSNCYVVAPAEDNIESIFDTAKKLARTYSYGGGAGTDFSNLRPKNAKVNNAAEKTTGSLSFMELMDVTTNLIGQAGRRGALMITLNINHPDIEDFVELKTNLDKINKANISVKVTDDFMRAVRYNEKFKLYFYVEDTGEEIVRFVDARQLMNKIAYSNWYGGEPGFLYWDKIESWNLLSEDDEFELNSTNPCWTGDTEVFTADNEKVSFKELAEKGEDVEVYSMNPNTLKIEIKIMRNPRLTRKNVPVYKLLVDKSVGNLGDDYDGLELYKVTADHNVYVWDKYKESMIKKEVKDLEKGDRLVSLQVKRQGWNNDLKKRIEENSDFSNHKVVGIEFVGYEDVYNGTVEDNYNYFVCDSEACSGNEITGILSANCGEEPLPDGGSCLLGHNNLSNFVIYPFEDKAYFDFDKFVDAVKKEVIYMNEVLDEGLLLHPLKEQRDSVRDWRQIGIGIMGLADLFIKMGIRYGSEESLNLSEQIGHVMINAALQQSALLAKEEGAYPAYKENAVLKSKFLQENATKETLGLIKKYGLRNSQLLTIAPTGSTSNILGVSGGIEPIYEFSYKRKTESLHEEEREYEVYTPIVKEYMERNDIYEEEDLPDYFVTTFDIDYNDRIDMQSVWQKYIDASISSTINLPNDIKIEDIKNIYMYGWEKGLKGITVYRKGCARKGILSSNENNEDRKVEMSDQDFIDNNICPNCKSELKHIGGCMECTNCQQFSLCSI